MNCLGFFMRMSSSIINLIIILYCMFVMKVSFWKHAC